jgi:hypothetical protein
VVECHGVDCSSGLDTMVQVTLAAFVTCAVLAAASPAAVAASAGLKGAIKIISFKHFEIHYDLL